MDAKDNGGVAPADESTPTDASGPTVATRRWHIPRRVLGYAAAALGLVVVATASWWYSCGFHGCPSAAQLQAWKPTEGGALLDRNGVLIAPLSPVKRVNVPLSRVPAHVQAAFVAVEDRRFREHDGIDWRGVARAFVENLKAMGVREGASTITMQLARNVFLSHRANERSIPRKLLEWRYAGLIEGALTKDEILERYLNAIYLGNGVYGVEGASQDLFGKSVNDVTLAEAALLAGLPKAPSNYTPRRDRARALSRRAVVLDVMEREGVAPAADINSARRARLASSKASWSPKRRTDSWAVELTRTVLDSLRRIGAIPAGLNDAQLRVFTTFDRRAQIAAERAVAVGATQVDNDGSSWMPWRARTSRTQGALVALDPGTGALRAVVGGRRIERKGFNRAISAHRQPGSAFKPFVYAAALQQGFTLASMVDDEPVTIGDGRTQWTPANFNQDYAGRMTLHDAIARSANAATVRVSRSVGIPRVVEVANTLGIDSDLPDVPALALGAGAVTPLELTAAYAPFGNGGVRVQPYAVERIEDIFGTVLWTRPPVARRQVLDPRDAFLMTALLRGVVDEGTGRGVRSAGVRGPVAGKTGTTNDGTDVWFVGYTPTLVAAVWFGADDPTPLGPNATGGRFAAPTWARFIRDGWHSPQKDSAWQPPAGVVSRTIDIGTGKRANDWCGPSRREWFREGTEPTETCETDAYLAMREPPDWHYPDVHIDGLEDLEGLDDVVNAALRAIDDPRSRQVARRVVDELRRAAERAQREAVREAQRAQREAQREIQRAQEREREKTRRPRG